MGVALLGVILRMSFKLVMRDEIGLCGSMEMVRRRRGRRATNGSMLLPVARRDEREREREREMLCSRPFVSRKTP